MQNHSQARQGALIAVSASAGDQSASDVHSYAPQVVDSLRRAPEQSLLGALRETSTRVLEGSIEYGQRPRLAMRPRRGMAAGHGRRWALYIANQEHAKSNNNLLRANDLKNVVSQTVDLKAELDTRGFRTLGGQIYRNQTATQIERLVCTAASAQNIQETDCLFIFYSGHGLPEGLVGYNYNRDLADVTSYKHLLASAKAAQKREIDVIILLDACHSGVLVADLQEEQIAYLMNINQGRYQRLITLLDFIHARVKMLDVIVNNLNRIILPSKSIPSGRGLILPGGRRIPPGRRNGGPDYDIDREAFRGEMRHKLRERLYEISDSLAELRGLFIAAFPDSPPPDSLTLARNQIVYEFTQNRCSDPSFVNKSRTSRADLRDRLSDVVTDILLQIESQTP